jgi:hypothetical protein
MRIQGLEINTVDLDARGVSTFINVE